MLFMARKNWSREELLLTLNLYCKLPFSKFSSTTPEIIHLANHIDRTPGAVAMKLSNFASLDDSLSQAGLANASRLDKEIWDEFTGDWDRVALESEEIMVSLTDGDMGLEVVSDLGIAQEETETIQTVKVRLGQKFFRATILANYNTRCCICDLPIESLLIASHIIPWKVDTANRLNPHNGMSLCAIHDKAFDRGLLTLDEKYQILLGSDLVHMVENEAVERFFTHYQHKEMHMPEKFAPRHDFLEYHRNHVFVE
jgi:putative restriction endonuclease